MDPVAYLSAASQRFLDNGDYDSAENLLSLILSIQERNFGKSSLETTAALFNLGLLHFAQNDYAKAEEYLLRCLAIERKVLEPSSRSISETVNILTELHVEKYLSRSASKQRALSA